jgi:hypothetical protein
MGLLVFGNLSKAATRIRRETCRCERFLVKLGERPLVESVLEVLEGECKV